jgi:3'-5' exoribonuclease
VTIQELIRNTPAEAEQFDAAFSCQILQIKEAKTKNGKPYFEIEIGDGTAIERFKVWQDSNVHDLCEELQGGECIRIEGGFRRNQFGLNIEPLRIRLLDEKEIQDLFSGSPEFQEELKKAFEAVSKKVEKMKDPRLRLLCRSFLTQYEEKFKRAAAARDFHHARRGGLLQHTAQMMESAMGLSVAYPDMNWDLVLAGVLFHDCGKLWENDYASDGFSSPITTLGELLGHITIGIEVVNRLWRSLEPSQEFSEPGTPPKELVREHLLHLIASHHGQKEYGAPVTPRTPEAWVLHYVDNLDARVEMLKQTYAEKPQVGPGIFDYRRPLEGRAVAPLPVWATSEK